MLGAGTVINPIIKIVTTVAILGAVYLFIVKPTLDTTETAFESFGDLGESFDGFDGLPSTIQSEIDDAFEGSGGSSSLQDCIQRAIDASAGPAALQSRTDRCISKFGS